MGFKIDGIASSEHVDSSGEILRIANANIDDLVEGKGVLNWEHTNDSASDIVARITFAKKILSRDDCDTDRQRKYWDYVKVPYIYIQAEFFDSEDHPGALAVSSIIRHYHKRKEKILVSMSVEGSTLERNGNILERTVARRVALTLRACNKTCITGVLDAPAEEIISKSMKDLINHSDYTIDSAILDDTSTNLQDLKQATEELETTLNKTLTAGVGNVAPQNLTQGAALQCEDISGRNEQLSSRTVRNRVKAAVRDWDRRRPLKEVIKAALPEIGDGYIDHFVNVANELTLKKSQSTNLIRVGQEHSQNQSQDDDQKRLIEGLYLDPAQQPAKTVIARNDAGQSVLIKRPVGPDIHGDAQQNAANYYQIAKYLGLGDNVPVTNTFSSPINKEQLQAIEIKEGFNTPLQSPRQYEKNAQKARESGELHKLAMLDLLLGNNDRHAANMLYNRDGKFLHIDNDHSFDHQSPHEHQMYHQGEFEGVANDMAHIDAVRWLNDVDPRLLVRHLTLIGLPMVLVKQIALNLKSLKQMASDGHSIGNMAQAIKNIKLEGADT